MTARQPITIICDKRELNSGVIKALQDLGAETDLQTLEVGDYIISNRAGIERKTAEDGIGSLVGEERGKIFRQCKDLAESYQRPLLLFECDLSDLFIRNIHPAAIWGMLRSIIWNGCPIEFTYTAMGTAKRLYELAQAEQNGTRKVFQPHGMKTKRNPQEQKEYLVSAIPDVGTATARDLLTYFGSVEAVMTASKENLMAVDGVGAKTADRIRDVCGGKYK